MKSCGERLGVLTNDRSDRPTFFKFQKCLRFPPVSPTSEKKARFLCPTTCIIFRIHSSPLQDQYLAKDAAYHTKETPCG